MVQSKKKRENEHWQRSRVEVIPHSPYNSDIVPHDYHLFLSFEQMGGEQCSKTTVPTDMYIRVEIIN